MANIYPMLDIGVTPPEQEKKPEPLESLFTKYYGEDDFYGKAEAAKKRRDELLTAYKGSLAGAAQVGEAEPSQAERYFKLAQAFLTPGKTGHFYESLGKVGETLGEMEEKKRLARRQQALDALKAAQTGQQLDIEAAGADIEMYTKLGEKSQAAQTELIKEILKQQKGTEPQSPAGKQAADEGLTPGTPAFHKRVSEIAQAAGDMQEARLNNALAQAALAEARFQRSGTEMGAAETRLLSETEDTLFAKQESKSLLAQALQLNPDTYDASIADTIARFAAEGLAPDNPKVVNTRDLQNILTGQMVASLRSTFGASPTDSEKQTLLDLQGLEAKSKKERERILKRAAVLVDARIKKDEARIKAIREGQYRYRTAPTE